MGYVIQACSAAYFFGLWQESLWAGAFALFCITSAAMWKDV